MLTHINNADVAAYFRDQGWIVVGHDLACAEAWSYSLPQK
jgi:hypothetical protein